MNQDTIAVIDLGSARTTDLARAVRALGVYTELHPHDLTAEQLAATVATVSRDIGSRGGRLVLLAADSADPIRRLGVDPNVVVNTTVREDEHVLEQKPSHTDPLPVRVWLAPALTP